MKNIHLLIFTLFSLISCKSTTSASDASVTAAFVIVVIIFLVIFIVGGYGMYEEAQEKKEEHKKQERQRAFYNSPKEIKKRETDLLKKQKKREANLLRKQEAKERLKIHHRNFRKENIHLFNSSKNLNLSIQKLSELISYCKKCENRDYTVWELSEKSLVYRCDVCKKKSTVNHEVVTYIFKNYQYYRKLYDYCKATEKKINIVWKRFHFDTTKFNVNTPLHRGITFKGFGTKQLEEPKVENDKKSRRISQDVKDRVWNRDGGKCVECGSNENLEFDHIIPHSKGGANTYRNIQLLCEPCNRSKSAKIG
jgi:Ca2+/Na+ antiporter